MVKIDTKDIDMALYVIDLKIANILKNGEKKNYNEVKDEIVLLKQEKQKIYQKDEETINKALNVYLKEVKE